MDLEQLGDPGRPCLVERLDRAGEVLEPLQVSRVGQWGRAGEVGVRGPARLGEQLGVLLEDLEVLLCGWCVRRVS